MHCMVAQQQLRRITFTRAVSLRNSGFFSSMIQNETRIPCQRSLHTTTRQNTRRDESTIDFAYMPRESFFPEPEPEQYLVPLLPDNHAPPLEYTSKAHNDVRMESVTKPTISTMSADGTHIDSPSALSDVTDNHAQEMDVFDLTTKVSAAAKSKAFDLGNNITQKAEGQTSALAALMNSLLDDIFGPKKPSSA